MCIVRSPPSCCYWKLNIPNGVFCMETKWGKHNGLMEPGCRCCYLAYKKVVVMISKNTIRFKCPIQDVPTKDNVRISIDVGINFHIGGGTENEENDCMKFFYNFGPNRLEELLKEECDEGIRNFIKGIKVIRARDIKTELTS